MASELNISEIYEQNLNFLIGSGASFGYLPTLQLSLKDSLTDDKYTVETLSVELTRQNQEVLNTLLFMHYYKSCIKPAVDTHPAVPLPPHRIEVINRYTNFLSTVRNVIKEKKSNDRKCNIYTTNYDGCLEFSAENILSQGGQTIAINDGASGFKKRYFHTKNYNNQVVQKGMFDSHASPIPQINILHIHGSVYWKKENGIIVVDYKNQDGEITFSDREQALLEEFSSIVGDDNSTEDDLLNFQHNDEIDCDKFWSKYNQLPIVNPTKWKFYETVFEENYYQILRHLSFELERPNTVFVSFGFSFADEHILHLVQRSLSNPSLTVYVCCFNSAEEAAMSDKFKEYPNVKLITTEENLDFSTFNSEVFTLSKNNGITNG
jgi:hypothetical protein